MSGVNSLVHLLVSIQSNFHLLPFQNPQPQSALPDPRPAALETYLARLKEAPPVLLAVYAFHMYMALLRCAVQCMSWMGGWMVSIE